MKLILIIFFTLILGIVQGQHPTYINSEHFKEFRGPNHFPPIPVVDTAIILSDSLAFEYMKDGFKPRAIYNPITKKTVWILDVISFQVPLYIDTTVKGKQIIRVIK